MTDEERINALFNKAWMFLYVAAGENIGFKVTRDDEEDTATNGQKSA